jgi:hypothetical protein
MQGGTILFRETPEAMVVCIKKEAGLLSTGTGMFASALIQVAGM